MKYLFSIVTILLLSLNTQAQELIQIIPNCNHNNIANDIGSNPKPQILTATADLRPKLLKKVKAKYTKEALELGVYGTISLNVVFQADGKIDQIRIIRGLPNGLNQQVIEAAQQIVFKPAMKDGIAVSVRMILEYSFSITRLNEKMVAEILRRDFNFLLPDTMKKLKIHFEKLKLSSSQLELQPLLYEARGFNILGAEQRREYMQLREEGVNNLCPREKEVYRELLGEMPEIVANPSAKFSEDQLAYKIKRLYGIRYSGIATMTIEQQKRFVALYNEAVLLGMSIVKK